MQSYNIFDVVTSGLSGGVFVMMYMDSDVLRPMERLSVGGGRAGMPRVFSHGSVAALQKHNERVDAQNYYTRPLRYSFWQRLGIFRRAR